MSFVANYCFPDQVLNIHSFSLLRYWLKHTKMPTLSRCGTPSPISAGSRTTSVESLTHSTLHIGTPDSPENLLLQSQSSLDNISIDSQSSAGFILPSSQSSPSRVQLSSSPLPFLAKSPGEQIMFGGRTSRPQTPLGFPEEPSDRNKGQFQARSVPSRRISTVATFSKLFSHHQGPKSGCIELQEKACEYCLRLIEQSERSEWLLVI